MIRQLAALLALSAACTAAAAQILIGQTSGFTGPVAPGVIENTDGARLWIDHINRHGGVNGQKIELVSMDDQFKPELAAENAKKLITERHVVALFLSRGTPHTEAIRPLLDQHKVPLVGPSTGAMGLHTPAHAWIFNVRAPYQREAEKTVTLLTSIGMSRIALVHVDDSFGADCAAGAIKGFERAKLQPVFLQKFDRDKPDYAPIVRAAVKTEAQAVIFIGAAGSVADGTRALRAGGSRAQIVTLSNNASSGFVSLMGHHARGTIVSQVFPYERSLSAPIVKEAYNLAAAIGLHGVTPAMLEGFTAAKVLVEGLRRAGPSPTRQKLRDALENMRKVDLGGLELNYGPGDHTGLDFADLSIVGPGGKFQR